MIYLQNRKKKNLLSSDLQELFNTGIEAVLYFIAFIVQLSVWSGTYLSIFTGVKGANIAAGVSIILNGINIKKKKKQPAIN